MLSESDSFFNLVRSPIKFRLFLLNKLPAAYFSGVRLIQISEAHSKVSVPFKWFTQNPFRSTYFACLSMAAEMSTGLLAMANIYHRKPPVSMLVTAIVGNFYKKASGKTIFICEDGPAVKKIVQDAIDSALPQTIKMKSSGYNLQNELVAEFYITWSFKVKSN